MHPILFKIGPLTVETYYVIWGAALWFLLLWTRKRAVEIYGFEWNAVTDVLFWMIIGVFVGASLGGYLDNWTRYAESPIRLLYFWESGLSSGPGFLGGGLAGLYALRKRSLSVDRFAESAAIPCAFMLFVGRIGCFMAGCCRGIASSCSLAVHFPGAEADVLPSQLFESFACLLIGIVLLVWEKLLQRGGDRQEQGALLWPVFMILYGGYRLVFDFWRAGDRILGLRVGQYSGLLALIVGVLWLAATLRRSRNGAR